MKSNKKRPSQADSSKQPSKQSSAKQSQAKTPPKKQAQSNQPLTEEARKKALHKKKLLKKKLLQKKRAQTKAAAEKQAPVQSKAGSSPIPKDSQSQLKRQTVSTATLPETLYRQARERLRIRAIIQFFMLLLLAMGVGMMLYVYSRYGAHQQAIMQNANQGLARLEEDRLEQARRHFSEALRQFRSYNPDPTLNQWHGDAIIYGLMFKVAQGYRSLGDFEKSLAVYGEIAKRNIKGRTRWVADSLFAGLRDTIESPRWSDQERQALYEHLLGIHPEDWRHGAYFQAWAAELAGLQVVPMEERYFNAEVVAYGTPRPMLSLDDKRFRVQAERFYRTDRLPSAIEFTIPAGMPPSLRKRLQWYSEAGYACLVFGSDTETGASLNGIEGVVLSDHHTVDPFNELVMENES